MKSYSFMRETAPVIMKNAPKEGTVLNCIDVRCIYSSGGIITHSDTQDTGEKWLKQTSAGYLLMIHAEVKTNNEYTRMQ